MARSLRVKVIGEGANLAVTQAGRIEFAGGGGRINTDFIDNSAGVDCSDNEVNIKIPLNREMLEGRLSFRATQHRAGRDDDEVAALVLEDNRLQTLALSIAERGGLAALPAQIRVIELLEESGRLDRAVEGLAGNEELTRRGQDGHGLTRPELAVLLSTSKMALQAAIEASKLTEDPSLTHELCDSFPKTMQQRHGDAILAHRLRREIIATEIANRLVNRLGILAPFALVEEEGVALAHVAAAFHRRRAAVSTWKQLWRDLDTLEIPEETRLDLFEQASKSLQVHMADLLRSSAPTARLTDMEGMVRAGVETLSATVDELLRGEVPRRGGGPA